MNRPSFFCSRKLGVGEWVEVLSKEEILATLDKNGRLDALPFMPEMFQFCGKRFQVYKRAHKTCDPPNGMQGRRMLDVVHLEGLRCDGLAHGGCQAGCLLFWKEAWLRRVGEGRQPSPELPVAVQATARFRPPAADCTEADLIAGTRAPGDQAQEPVYVCQSTSIGAATQPLRWWDIRQYAEDLASGNVRLSQMCASFLYFLCYTLAESGIGLGGPLRWAYDRFQKIRGGTPYPSRMGKVPKGVSTPKAKLDLQVGELVKVKEYQEILETLDEEWKNRGMYFDAEGVPFCKGTYRVQQRVQQIINEKTGKMMHFKTDALILDGVFCRARYSKCRLFCPRSIYPYWREIWLERVLETTDNSAKATFDKSSVREV
jgi:hypothetical protein